jgi:hypothetical protein
MPQRFPSEARNATSPASFRAKRGPERQGRLKRRAGSSVENGLPSSAMTFVSDGGFPWRRVGEQPPAHDLPASFRPRGEHGRAVSGLLNQGVRQAIHGEGALCPEGCAFDENGLQPLGVEPEEAAPPYGATLRLLHLGAEEQHPAR